MKYALTCGRWNPDQIDLGHGIKTSCKPPRREPVDHPMGIWRIIERCLPVDLAGRSVLDVGLASAWLYVIEAKAAQRRACARHRFTARTHPSARFAARVLDLDIGYQRMSVYDLSPHRNGKFEITLALDLSITPQASAGAGAPVPGHR